MKKHLILFTLALCSFFFSCKKAGCHDNEQVSVSFDTVPMHPYFPAYPGSFWEYDDGSTVTVGDYTLKKLNNSNMPYDSCIYEYNSVQPVIDYPNEHSYLGLVASEYFLVGNKFYPKDNQTKFGAYVFHGEVIDTIIGKKLWSEYVSINGPGAGGHSSTSESVIEYLESIDIQDTTYTEVYKTRIRRFQSSPYGSFTTYLYKYYAKNVGLIIEEKLDDIQYPAYRKELVNYHISN